MSGCFDTGRPGCRGMLCRSAHASLRQLPVMRYPADEYGRPDLSAQPEAGWVCALISCRSGRSGSTLGVPGTTGGQLPMQLAAAAGSLTPPLAAGDRVTVDGQCWRAVSVVSGQPVTAELIPEAEEQ